MIDRGSVKHHKPNETSQHAIGEPSTYTEYFLIVMVPSYIFWKGAEVQRKAIVYNTFPSSGTNSPSGGLQDLQAITKKSVLEWEIEAANVLHLTFRGIPQRSCFSALQSSCKSVGTLETYPQHQGLGTLDKNKRRVLTVPVWQNRSKISRYKIFGRLVQLHWNTVGASKAY